MNNIYDSISKLYTEGGFLNLYASDLLIVGIVMLIVFIVYSYYSVMNRLRPIKDDWINQRCNPSVIPFAGVINPQDGKSALDYTAENFTSCTQTILEDITEYALLPFHYLLNVINIAFSELDAAINSMRAEFNNMRNSADKVTNNLYSRAMNITAPIIKNNITMKSMFSKTQGTMATAIYMLYGGYMTTQSLFSFIYNLVVKILETMVASIAALFVVSFFFPPAFGAALLLIATMTVVIIASVVMLVIMQNIFKASGMRKPPGIPKK